MDESSHLECAQVFSSISKSNQLTPVLLLLLVTEFLKQRFEMYLEKLSSILSGKCCCFSFEHYIIFAQKTLLEFMFSV